MTSIPESNPQETWDALKADSNAVLVDVRTRAEWSFVGAPDLDSLGRKLVLLEWRRFPDMAVNESFTDELDAQLDGPPSQIFFICRSGARSLQAASVTAQHLQSKGISAACINVAEGFEGDLDADGHRGGVNGWKARNLAWRQS